MVYLDDILIFMETLEQHWEVTRRVLALLKKHKLFLKPNKCEFEKTRVEYLGVIMSHNSVEMDPAKIAGVAEWLTPTTKKEVQSFLGFTNFYRRFIEDFTLPHRFLVIPPGIHLDSRWNLFGREPSQIFVYFHLDSTWIPDGLHGLHVESMDSTPFHITLHSIFHLSMDSTWTPAVLIIYFVGIGLLMKIKSHDGPKNGFHKA